MLKIFAITLFLLTGALSPALAAESAPATGAAGHQEHPAWFKESFLDLRDDVKEATGAKRRVMLYFYQNGCPYCDKLLRDNFGQKAIADKTRRHFEVIAINLWGDREVTDMAGKTHTEKSFAKSLRVQFTPTLLVLDEAGETALRLNGYIPPHKFESALDFASRKRDKNQRFADYLAEHARQPASGKLNGESWLLKPPLKLAAAVKGAKPLLVLFEQKECAACDALHWEAFPRPEVAELLKRFQVAQIDMASPERVETPGGQTLPSREWARGMNIFYAPSLVFFDAQGRESFRVEGYLEPFHFASSLDYVASGAYRTQPEFQRFIEARIAARREMGEQADPAK